MEAGTLLGGLAWDDAHAQRLSKRCGETGPPLSVQMGEGFEESVVAR